MPPALASEMGLSEIENQAVEIHLAIGDESSGVHYSANTEVIAGTTGLIDFNSIPYSYSVGHNSIKSTDATGSMFPRRD